MQHCNKCNIFLLLVIKLIGIIMVFFPKGMCHTIQLKKRHQYKSIKVFIVQSVIGISFYVMLFSYVSSCSQSSGASLRWWDLRSFPFGACSSSDAGQKCVPQHIPDGGRYENTLGLY